MTPHQIGHAGRSLKTDRIDGAERHPEIAAIDQGFTHRPKTGIAVHQPFKGVALFILQRDLPAACRGLFECRQAQRLRLPCAFGQRLG